MLEGLVAEGSRIAGGGFAHHFFFARGFVNRHGERFFGAHHIVDDSRAPVQQIAQFNVDRIDLAPAIGEQRLCFGLCHRSRSMPSRSERAKASICASLEWFSSKRTNAL